MVSVPAIHFFKLTYGMLV